MAITYGSQAGTTLTTSAYNTTGVDQTQQTNNNTVVVSDTLGNAGGGQIGDGTNGIGDSYVGRLIIINPGTTQQVRLCVSAAAGTTTTYILTVHEDWDTNPVSGDIVCVPYEPADIEDGGVGGGIALGSKTGLWELSNTLTIGDGTEETCFQLLSGAALEINDDGASVAFIVAATGYLYMGYESAGTPVNGAIITGYNNANAEPWLQIDGYAYLYNSLLWSQLRTLNIAIASTYEVIMKDTRILRGTEEISLYYTDFNQGSITGAGIATEFVRVSGSTDITNVVLSNTGGLHTLDGSTVNAWINKLRDMVFTGNVYDITVNTNKRWTVLNPVWDATPSDYSNINFLTATNNYVYENFSIDLIITDKEGTTLSGVAWQGAEIGTWGASISHEDSTESDGIILGQMTHHKYFSASVTTTSGFSFKVSKFPYIPFVQTLVAGEAYENTIPLLDDPNVVETDWLTAAGGDIEGTTLGITWNEFSGDPLDPSSSIIEYTGGTGSLTAGMIIQGGSSTASGTVTYIIEGDSTAGTVHLSTRDVTAFSSSETVSRVGGTAGTWSATYTAASQQNFKAWIDGNNKSLQTIYDFSAAHMDRRSEHYDWYYDIADWGRGQQSQPIYVGAGGYYTERSHGEGIIMVNYGAGVIDYFTNDDGGTFTPYVGIQLTISANVTLVGAEVRIYDYESAPPDFGTELDGVESHDSATFVFEDIASNLIYIQIMKDGYEEYGSEYTMPTANGSFFADMQIETNT